MESQKIINLLNNNDTESQKFTIFTITQDCILSSANSANPTSFKITETKLYVPIATLSTKDNVNLTKQLNEGFKRSAYWNEYKSKIETKMLIIIMSLDFPLMVLF